MACNWQRLHPEDADGAPPLLYTYTTRPEGYTFGLTDMTRIWSETLDGREVLQRCDEVSPWIDPADDPSQFSVLLDQIGEALSLKTSRPTTENSSIVVENGGTGDFLRLSITLKLPWPLPPLRWSMHLRKEDENAGTKQLLIPLLKEAVYWESRERKLFDLLKEKDEVIGKIFDDSEMNVVDLTSVFPTLAGPRASRGGTTLAQAATLIKGVAPFDERQWLNAVSGAETSSSAKSRFPNLPDSDENLTASIVSNLKEGLGEEGLQRISAAPNAWWASLDKPKSSAGALPMRNADQKQNDAIAETQAMPNPSPKKQRRIGYIGKRKRPELENRDEERSGVDKEGKEEGMETQSEERQAQTPATAKSPQERHHMGHIADGQDAKHTGEEPHTPSLPSSQTVTASPSSPAANPKEEEETQTKLVPQEQVPKEESEEMKKIRKRQELERRFEAKRNKPVNRRKRF